MRPRISWLFRWEPNDPYTEFFGKEEGIALSQDLQLTAQSTVRMLKKANDRDYHLVTCITLTSETLRCTQVSTSEYLVRSKVSTAMALRIER